MNSTPPRVLRGALSRLLLGGLICSAVALDVDAQLAITEVMSWASTNCAVGWNPPKPDFWELYNFGRETIDITDYWFCDRDKTFAEGAWRLGSGRASPLRIGPNESIIFVRGGGDTVTNLTAFRNWWGEDRLPKNLQVIYWPADPGLDQNRDGVRLWDANSNLVDRVVFDQATQGVTFTYDRANGQFGVKSSLKAGGAFRAAECEDIGSPGYDPGEPIKMQITTQPVSQTVDAGGLVTFNVVADIGLPRPRGHQWFHDGKPVVMPQSQTEAIPVVVNYVGAGLAWRNPPNSTDLTILNATPEDAGEYFAVITNGLEEITSQKVILTVRTLPSPPRIESPPPQDRFPFIGGRPQTNLTVTPAWRSEDLVLVAQRVEFAALVGG